MTRLETPVVFIIYKRPETTRRAWEAIASQRPRRLFIVADGPRPDRPEEAEKVAQTRAVVERVDWKCKVDRVYASENLGLRRRVVSGINHVFSQVERAIIIEDDIVPAPSFFPYCDDLLERYCEDERIMAVGGFNPYPRWLRTSYSYYFSRYAHPWGWATWRRAWAKYDDDLSLWPRLRDAGWLDDVFEGNRRAARYWRGIFDQVAAEKIDSWAYRWMFACWAHSGLTALPAVNLVANIGFGGEATNTTIRRRKEMDVGVVSIPPHHPPFVTRNTEADRYTEAHHYGSSLTKQTKRLVVRILKKFGFFSG